MRKGEIQSSPGVLFSLQTLESLVADGMLSCSGNTCVPRVHSLWLMANSGAVEINARSRVNGSLMAEGCLRDVLEYHGV